MKKKFYFEDEDAEHSYSEEYFQEQMKAEGITEMKVILAVPIAHSKSDFVYCEESDECYEKSECCKSRCEAYKPKNGKNGRCEFRGQYADFGEDVILKVKQRPAKKATIRVIANGLFGLTTSIVAHSSGKIPVWYPDKDTPEFINFKDVRFEVRGMDLIKEERREQIEKHHWPIQNDKWYGDGQLARAALFCLNQSESFAKFVHKSDWPEGWDEYFKNKIINKDEIGKLSVAGAFYLAEIERSGADFSEVIETIAEKIDIIQNNNIFK